MALLNCYLFNSHDNWQKDEQGNDRFRIKHRQQYGSVYTPKLLGWRYAEPCGTGIYILLLQHHIVHLHGDSPAGHTLHSLEQLCHISKSHWLLFTIYISNLIFFYLQTTNVYSFCLLENIFYTWFFFLYSLDNRFSVTVKCLPPSKQYASRMYVSFC